MNNLLQRTFSGIIYLIVIIGSLLLGKFAFGALFLIIALLALIEFYNLTGIPGYAPLIKVCVFSGLCIFLLCFLTASGTIALPYLIIALVFPVIIFIVALYSDKTEIVDLSKALLGVLYIIVPVSAINFLAFTSYSEQHYSHRIILGILILVWINDTAAYVAGSVLGRHKLFPRISPKKSWEGFFGGTLFTMLSACWMGKIVGILSTGDWIVIGIIASILGVYGDLTESFFKRKADKKDSGSLIPGHGGMLDRIDSILFVMPAALIYLLLKSV